MKYIQTLMVLFLVSCNNEKVLQLPEIDHSDISEILDVSPAYLFYDETKKDSIDLNRKTLIITTNWLINVDKRLTLEQVIPNIIYLQDKKRSAELHKNEDAKNYYTCHNTSIHNLGFIEFTDVFYIDKQPDSDNLKSDDFHLIFQSPTNIEIHSSKEETTLKISEATLLQTVKDAISINNKTVTLYLYFNKNLSFQEYISFKALLNKLEDKKVIISNKEFLFN